MLVACFLLVGGAPGEEGFIGLSTSFNFVVTDGIEVHGVANVVLAPSSVWGDSVVCADIGGV